MRHAPVLEHDDGPHPVGPEPNFSESAYFQFGDPSSGLSGFLRLANRPNEGSGERTVCLFLPDGRVAFAFARPTFDDPASFAAAGLRVDVVAPLAHQRVSYLGDVTALADGWAMTDPRRAMAASPTLPCTIELDVTALAPARHFSLDEEGDFSAHHFDQFSAVRGTIRVADMELTLDGHGLRDRSWGPRSWQAPSFYRYMFGAGEEFGLAAAVLGRGDVVRVGGFVWDGERIRALEHVVARPRYDDDDAVEVIALDVAAGDRSWRISGAALNAIPLRNRRDAAVTRILETAVRWDVDGHTMIGVAEFLDQIVDDRPVGIAAYDDTSA